MADQRDSVSVIAFGPTTKSARSIRAPDLEVPSSLITRDAQVGFGSTR